MKPKISRTMIIFVTVIAASMLSSLANADSALMRDGFKRPTDIPFPEENGYTDAKAVLGKMLFFDPRLSRENNITCASCHNPSFAWEDAQTTSVGTPMSRLGRHTPTVLNLAWGELFFWDGRSESLEEQALGPIQAGGEMAQDLDLLIAELKAVSGYVDMFEAAFPREGITAENIGKAIATYERTIVSAKAPFDHWIEGDENAINAAAKRGFELFNTKAKCASCHDGWNFTDWSFHDIGLGDADEGRYEVLDIDVLKHSFKTPGLRNINERAPYMHNGSLATLEEVVEHYDSGFVKRASLSSEMQELNLTKGEKHDLVAFIKTLSSNDPQVSLPKLPN
ncbi:cytochrome-c peroxidase [Kordiimonas aquimaris]|uniref:cytochrome-c peroxidase n=1 Tax=Kordiimonas aquimaris TaxID=707591 RepID=UPI0021CF15CE|nr:cytochrome c peroxidase [Kordiimonas aquimaris]